MEFGGTFKGSLGNGQDLNLRLGECYRQDESKTVGSVDRAKHGVGLGWSAAGSCGLKWCEVASGGCKRGDCAWGSGGSGKRDGIILCLFAIRWKTGGWGGGGLAVHKARWPSTQGLTADERNFLLQERNVSSCRLRIMFEYLS